MASTPGEASVSERDQTRDGSVGPSGQGLCGGDGPVGRRARGASAAAQIGVRRPRLARWWVGSGSPARRSVGHGARRVPSARCCRSPGPSPRRPGPGPGTRCLQDNSARQCQGRPLLGSARGGMCCCCGCGRCPPRAHPERASLGDRASVGRWRRLGPECRVPSPLWGVDAREGGPPEAAPACPCPTSPGGCSWKPKGGAQVWGRGRQLAGSTAWSRIGLHSVLLLFLLWHSCFCLLASDSSVASAHASRGVTEKAGQAGEEGRRQGLAVGGLGD